MKIPLSTPDNKTVFQISDTPQMPTVAVDAAMPGSEKASFQWSVQLRFLGTETEYGKSGTPLQITKTTLGGRLIVNPGDWGNIRGGSLTVNVTANVNGQTATGQLQGLSIVGKNPSVADVRASLGADPLRRIAHQESGFCQFGDDCWPLFSKDDLGGAGIMQITPASENQIWNWRSNVEAGIKKYNQCYGLGPIYLNSLRTSDEFAALVSNLNKTRALQKLPTSKVTISDWTADQRIRDAIRGYNGWAGSDPIDPKFVLHEYKLSLDSSNQLQVTVAPDGNSATAVWVPVPWTARPPKKGDTDYVAHVMAQNP